MATLLQIAQLGSLVLRKKAKRVRDVKSIDIQTLIDDLLMTLKDANGVGIAAPQVYNSVRIMIIASHPNPRYPKAPNMKPIPMINPKLISHGNKTKKDWEGCLSIPGIRALVPRYIDVTLEYADQKGEMVTRKFKDFIARIVQHEYDHLEGILYLDRLESNKDIVSEKEFLKIISKK